MASIAFLTTELEARYVTDDHLALPLLRDRGVDVAMVSWRRPSVDWASFDLVVVRSTWDYHRHLDAFLETLEAIDGATRLENPLELQLWNIRKTYMRDLAVARVPVVPTLWRDRLEPGDLAGLFQEVGGEEIVVKPVVGSSGEDAFRIKAEDAPGMEPELLERFRTRPLMAQPFLSGVLDRGEVSVVWIAGAPSHALRKTPRPGDFRSQEEHGGRVESVDLDGSLRAAADRVWAVAERRSPTPALYGRVDFLPGEEGWLVGELELVEPSLYLRVSDGAGARFADAITDALTGRPR